MTSKFLPDTADADWTSWAMWIVCIIFFLLWAYQIIKSMSLYIKTDKQHKYQIIFIHFVLMGANLLYLGYEVQASEHYLPFYFTMIFLLNLASVYAFALLIEQEDDKYLPKSEWDIYFIRGAFALNWIIFIVAWFLPTGYGATCVHGKPEFSFWLMGIFQIAWTAFVLFRLHTIKVEGGFKYMLDLLLLSSRKEYNKADLQHAQLRIFKLLSIINVSLQIVALLQIQILDILNNHATGGMPKWLLNTCVADKNGFYKKDSGITQALACGIIACPIQQFISCFFAIPERYGYFEVKAITNKVRENIVDLFKNAGHMGDQEKVHERQPLNKTNENSFGTDM